MRRGLTLVLLFGGLGVGVFGGGCGGDGTTTPDAGGDGDAGTPDGAAPTADAAPPDATPPPIDESLPIFTLDTLHEIVITVDPMYLDALENDRVNRVPCTISYDGVVVANAGIRQKGGIGSVSTLSGKPGFSLKFDELVMGQELFGEEKLLLNNAIQDPTFLHEHLGYEVYRRAGIPAARTAHGIVTLNGFTYGLYVVSEATDKEFLKRAFGDGNQQGNLYEGECCGDFVWDPFFPELKNEIEEMRTRDDLIALTDVIANASDAEFATLVTPHLDLDGFIKGYAIDAIFYHWDGYAYNTNNHYMYDNPVDSRFVFMPHGMDQLLQNLDFSVNDRPNGRLAQRVREIDALAAQWRAAIADLLATAWDIPLLQARLDLVNTVVHTTTRTDERTLSDLQSFDENFLWTRDALAYRRDRVLESLSCGNGILESAEGCDDGNNISGDGCNSGCYPEYCGDGTAQPLLGEVCDGAGCLPDCSGFAMCQTFAGPSGGSFVICPVVVDHAGAQLDCLMRGGALAVPADTTENDFLVATLPTIANQVYWLGLDDTTTEDTWVATDGTPATFFAWAPGRPNGGTAENCAIMDNALGYGWNDRSCGDGYGFVCRLP